MTPRVLRPPTVAATVGIIGVDNAFTPALMTAEDQPTPAGRAASLLQRGPAPVPTRSLRERLRAMARAALLRAARPQARYQRELDETLVAGLGQLETELVRIAQRHDEQIERLEDLVRELVLSVEALRRGLVDGDGAEDLGREA